MKFNKWKEKILEGALVKEALLDKATRKGSVRLIWLHAVRIPFSDPQFCIKTLDLAEQPL